MKTKSAMRGKLQLAFGSAVLVLLVVGAIALRTAAVADESDLWVRHTHEVLENIADLLSTMQNLESSARGFILTGRESYLETYRASVVHSQAQVTLVRNLTLDNPAQQRQIPILENLAAQKIQLAERIIAVRRAEGLEPAVAATLSGGGQQIMDAYREVIREMQAEEHRLLVLRDADAKRRLGQTKTVLILGTFLGVLIAASAGWSAHRDSLSRGLAEVALRNSEEKYRRLIQGVQDYAILMLGPEGEIRSWNPGAERMTGCKFEEVAGQNFSRFFSPEDVQRGRPAEILRMAAAGGSYEEQGMRMRKNGGRFLVRTTYTASRDLAGDLRGFSVVSRDLSQGAESDAKYRGLLEAAPDAMVVVNQDGEIVLLNVQAEKQFGYSRDELVGQKVKNIIPEGFAERLIADGTRSAAEALAQQIGTGIELIARRRDGTEFPIEIMLSPLDSAEGTLVTAAIRDISVRKAAEKHLAQMEGRYRGLLEAAPDAMVVVNQGGEIVLLNVQAEKQFGYSRDELIGQKVKNIIPKGFAERLIADGTRSAAEALAQQIGTGIELVAQRKNRTEFPIEIMLSPLESMEGTLVTAAIRDISVRKAAEKHLAQMEGRYRGLLEAAPDAMVVVNQGGEIVLLNVQAEKQFGYSRDELVGQKVKNIIPEGFAERLIADGTRSAAEALAQQIGTGIELIARRKNRTEFPIEIMLSPLESTEGTLVTAAIRDISVRKAAEKHLAQMEGRYRGLLEAAPDAMVVVNQDGEIVLLNVQAEKQFGYSRDELIGQKVKNIIPKGFAERLIADGTRSAAEALAQQIGTGIELVAQRKNRTEFPIEIMLSPLESMEGTLVTAAIRDISVRKAAEKHLAQMEGRYRGLLEAAPDAMVVVNQDGEIVLLNVQAEKQFGYSRDELIGQKVKNIIPEGFAERLIADGTRSAAEALAQQIGTGIELVAQRKNRTEFPIEIMLSPLESTEGTLVTAAIRDISVRKAAEKHLAQMEGRYRGLLEAAPDAMVVVNQGGEIVLLNVQAEKQFGYSRDELIGQKVKNIIPKGFAERLIADGTRSAAEALAQQIGTGIELVAQRKNGTEFPIEIMLSPLESTEGTLVTAAIRDISVRRAAEKHLAQMESRYRGLLEAAPDAMVVVNPAGEIVLLNVQAEKQFGYQRDELVGQKVKNIIPEGFAERLIADGTRSAAEALAQQIGTGIELIARRKNRSAFPIEIMLSPLESAEGTLVTAAIRDISVRKTAEKHLAQMEGRYRGLLEAAPDAMVVVNQGGEIVLLNVQAEKQFGYSRDELVGQKVKNIIPEGFAERLVSDALRSVEDALAQQIGTGIELNGKRKNGSEFPIEIMLSPLESAEGTLVTAAVRDITARRQAEANLLNKVEELNRSNEELGQFAYIASHDLQEPLRMVASYTQLLSRRYKGKLDSDADEFIAFAVDGASRMQRLIQDLLAYSRVGTKGRDMVEVSSEDALQQALINLRSAIEEKGALVTHDSLPPVIADDMQLVQLFQNLVGNAIKYQSSGVPRVHITAHKNGAKKWTFSVKDNGLGIDPQYFEKIFGMFQRLHKREEFAGTGIGLAICKKIVERHGGSISVESQPGEGSTFRFALAESEKNS